MAEMEITTRIGCKVACNYCPQGPLINAYYKKNNDRLMSLDTFKTCLDKIPKAVTIHFSGFCEPWLNPECTKMVLYAHEAGHQIGIFTTLVDMTTEDAEMLESVPFKFFKIHLPSEERYEKIKMDDQYLTVLDRISASRIPAEYHSHGEAHHELKDRLKDQIKSNITGTRAGNIEIDGIAEPSSFRCYPKRFRGVIGCRRFLTNNVLLPNGDVSLCCADFGLKHIIGNLLEMDYDTLFESEEFLKVKEGLKDDSKDILCRHCETFSFDISLYAKLSNYYLPMINNVHNLGDAYRLMLRALRKLGSF